MVVSLQMSMITVLVALYLVSTTVLAMNNILNQDQFQGQNQNQEPGGPARRLLNSRQPQPVNSEYVVVSWNNADRPDRYAGFDHVMTVNNDRIKRRCNLTEESKKKWKLFKLKSEAILALTHTHVQNYIKHSASRFHSYEASKANNDSAAASSSTTSTSARTGGINAAQNPVPVLMERPLSSKYFERRANLLGQEAQHYMDQFKALRDGPRAAAAAKHFQYSLAAQRLALFDLSKLQITKAYHHDFFLQDQDRHLEAARAAHRLKESKYRSKNNPEW
ncbi:hypothetical protein CBS101457_005114 [Exobasidium rhododendri]|nr:hypothetical protein CBS101457_005114 [Exobasidium rhododendri]